MPEILAHLFRRSRVPREKMLGSVMIHGCASLSSQDGFNASVVPLGGLSGAAVFHRAQVERPRVIHTDGIRQSLRSSDCPISCAR